MKKFLPLLGLLWSCLLCGCAPETEPPAGTVKADLPSPSATPEPVSLAVTDESAEEILALGAYGSLREIDASASEEYDALLTLSQTLPDCHIHWMYPVEGEKVSSDTEELTVTDGAELIRALPYLPALRRVDATACALTGEEMDSLMETYPAVDFLWTVRFGEWEVRSDITCFSTLNTDIGYRHRYTDEELYPLLRFCPHLRALDLGHNDLCDLTLIGELQELQVLILADNPRITDITPLGNLRELRYLELFVNVDIRDFRCLARNVNMTDLNLCYCKNLDNADFIGNMPHLANAWFRFTGLTGDDLAPYRDRGINFNINRDRSDVSSTSQGWRDTDRNRAIRRAFSHWEEVEEFVSWDNIIYYGDDE